MSNYQDPRQLSEHLNRMGFNGQHSETTHNGGFHSGSQPALVNNTSHHQHAFNHQSSVRFHDGQQSFNHGTPNTFDQGASTPAPVTPQSQRSARLGNSSYFPDEGYPPTTPTRSNYSGHVTPRLYSSNGRITPGRHISFPRSSSFVQQNMDQAGQDEGSAGMGNNFQDNAGPSMDPTFQYNVGDGHGAPPRRVPSLAQLPGSHQLTIDRQFDPFHAPGSGGLRRMTSTPALMSHTMAMPAPGNAPVHIPSHPAALSLPSPAGVTSPARDEVAEFFHTIKVMILEAVQINRYKNGLFVTSITPRSDLSNDLNILCNSNQVMGFDNMRLANIRADVEAIKRKIAAGETVGKNIMGVTLTVNMLYGHNINELRDVLLSTDKVEHARWMKYYGGGNSNNNTDGINGGSGSAFA